MARLRKLRKLLLLLWTVITIICKICGVVDAGWTLEAYPNPSKAGSKCRGTRLCDPDGILTEEELKVLNDELMGIEGKTFALCSKEGGIDIRVEMAVALLKEMIIPPDLLEHHEENDVIDKATERFARGLHDEWGVGFDSEKCGGGTGILFFLSLHDRSIYISTGRAVQAVLSDKRLDNVIETTKPLLRSRHFASAIGTAIDQMEEYLEKGPPSHLERVLEFVEDYAFFIFLAPFIVILCYSTYKEQKDRREYAEVASRLNQLDRERAMALQGQYKCTSCPICFEKFLPSSQASASVEDRRDCDASELKETEPMMKDANDTVTGEATCVRGSDGFPLKLLRCGHVFDETCWKEWIASGQGDIRKCPICKQDLAGSPPPSSPEADAQRSTVQSLTSSGLQQRTSTSNTMERHGRNRSYDLERQFRLMRMMQRYPNYISRTQVDRWSRSEYDGRITQDRDFVNRNPANQSSSSSSRGSGSSGGGASFSSSFGGGTSAGGRGGRW